MERHGCTVLFMLLLAAVTHVEARQLRTKEDKLPQRKGGLWGMQKAKDENLVPCEDAAVWEKRGEVEREEKVLPQLSGLWLLQKAKAQRFVSCEDSAARKKREAAEHQAFRQPLPQRLRLPLALEEHLRTTWHGLAPMALPSAMWQRLPPLGRLLEELAPLGRSLLAFGERLRTLPGAVRQRLPHVLPWEAFAQLRHKTHRLMGEVRRCAVGTMEGLRRWATFFKLAVALMVLSAARAVHRRSRARSTLPKPLVHDLEMGAQALPSFSRAEAFFGWEEEEELPHMLSPASYARRQQQLLAKECSGRKQLVPTLPALLEDP